MTHEISDADIDQALAKEEPRQIVQTRPKPEVPIVDGRVVVSTLEGAYRMGHFLHETGLCPKGVRDPAQATLIVLTGMELGLTLSGTLANIAIINGLPKIWGDAALAVVRRRDDCEGVHEELQGEGDDMVAVCVARRTIAATSEQEVVERTFSVADAKKAGLWGKAGPWSQYPKRMLQMRARAFALRDLWPDALACGIVEEYEGVGDIDGPKKLARKAGQTIGDALEAEVTQ